MSVSAESAVAPLHHGWRLINLELVDQLVRARPRSTRIVRHHPCDAATPMIIRSQSSGKGWLSGASVRTYMSTTARTWISFPGKLGRRVSRQPSRSVHPMRCKIRRRVSGRSGGAALTARSTASANGSIPTWTPVGLASRGDRAGAAGASCAMRVLLGARNDQSPDLEPARIEQRRNNW
jgi:hypothetical protein